MTIDKLEFGRELRENSVANTKKINEVVDAVNAGGGGGSDTDEISKIIRDLNTVRVLDLGGWFTQSTEIPRPFITAEAGTGPALVSTNEIYIYSKKLWQLLQVHADIMIEDKVYLIERHYFYYDWNKGYIDPLSEDSTNFALGKIYVGKTINGLQMTYYNGVHELFFPDNPEWSAAEFNWDDVNDVGIVSYPVSAGFNNTNTEKTINFYPVLETTIKLPPNVDIFSL